MAIRAIDPAKRARATSAPAALPIPGRQLHPAPAASGFSPDAVAARSRVRSLAPAAPPGGAASAQPAGPAKRAHHIVDRTGPNWDEDGDYLVGKGRPPKAHQWQKGQSGNPRGPKRAEKLSPEAAFDKAVLSDFIAKVNGEEVKLNMGAFAVQLLKASAVKGTVKAQQTLLDLFITTMRRSGGREDAPEVDALEQEFVDKLLEEYGLPPSPVFRKTDRTVEGEDRS